jgi:hypothetical protein
VPILIPSETVIVPKGTAFPPVSSTPATEALPNSSRWELHGVTILQAEQTATWGFSKSSSSKPTALSIERLGARSSPSTTMDEKLRLHEFIEIDYGLILFEIKLDKELRKQRISSSFATTFFCGK